MLIPQFTMRRMLIAVTGLSVVFVVLAQAVAGQLWAIGVIVGLVALAAILLVHGITFFMVWLFAGVTAKRKPDNAPKVVAWLAAMLAATEALAGGSVLTLPLNGLPALGGLTVTFDNSWPDGSGYRPLTFTVTSAPVAKADRTLSFEVRAHVWNSKEPLLTVRTELELPAGAAQVTKTIAAPDFLYLREVSLETWVDGRHQPTLSTNTPGRTSAYYEAPDLMPVILFVTDAQPDATSLNRLFPERQYNVSPNNAAPSFAQQWGWRTASSLPEQWLCYQSLDLVFISLADLKTLTPGQLTAIRDWTRTGGNLMVSGAGSDWSGLDSLGKLLGDNSDDQKNLWQLPDAGLVTGANRDMFVDVQWPVEQEAQPATAGTTVAPPHFNATTPNEAPFRLRPYQQGMIVPLAPDDPFDQALSSTTWYWVMNSLGGTRWVGSRRTGIASYGNNPDFWTFLIPGVGGAPVNAYRILITAFVILIGPVNYLVLRKRRRLHLLLFTVPVSALLVTSALMAYALVADGLYTRVRSRSFTMLDQRTGDAVSWARLAYYSGLAPADGLRFAPDVAVLPYAAKTEPFDRRAHRVFDAQADHNQFERGWLPSRTLTQVITARPCHTTQKLVVTEAAGAISVQNKLGLPIQQLLVCGAAGELGYGCKILPGQTCKLVPVTTSGPDTVSHSSGSVEDLRDAFQSQVLAPPDGFDQRGMGIFNFNTYAPYNYYGNANSGQQSTSRLESGIEAARLAVTQAGTSTTGSTTFTPRSYIAIIDRPEQVQLGLESPTETAGFHVLRGEY